MNGQKTIDAELVRKADVEARLQNLELLSQCCETRDIFETEHAAFHDILTHIMNPLLKIEYGRHLQRIVLKQAVYLLRIQLEASQRSIDSMWSEVEQMQAQR